MPSYPLALSTEFVSLLAAFTNFCQLDTTFLLECRLEHRTTLSMTKNINKQNINSDIIFCAKMAFSRVRY